MKKILLTCLTVILGSQMAKAADMYCGANIETVPGSQIYNKSVFYDKTDTTRMTLRYLTADGTLLKQEELTPDDFTKIADGTLVFGISFFENRPSLFLARIKRNEAKEIQYTDLSIATILSGNNVLLIANGASLVCMEK